MIPRMVEEVPATDLRVGDTLVCTVLTDQGVEDRDELIVALDRSDDGAISATTDPGSVVRPRFFPGATALRLATRPVEHDLSRASAASREQQILDSAKSLIFGTDGSGGLNLASTSGQQAAEAVLAGAMSSLAAIDSPILSGGAR